MDPGAEHADDAAQPLRSDAERNRARIVAAARLVFGRGGLNSSMASVAREAGWATPPCSVTFGEGGSARGRVRRSDGRAFAAVAAALDEPYPWHGLVGFVESVCAMQAADYGFADVLTMTFPTAKALEQPRREVHEVWWS